MMSVPVDLAVHKKREQVVFGSNIRVSEPLGMAFVDGEKCGS